VALASNNRQQADSLHYAVLCYSLRSNINTKPLRYGCRCAGRWMTAFPKALRLLWVGWRPTTLRTHRRKADVEGSLPESCHWLVSRFDPEESFANSTVLWQVTE